MSKHKEAAEAAEAVCDIWERIHMGDEAEDELDGAYEAYFQAAALALSEKPNPDLFVCICQTLMSEEHLLDQWDGLRQQHEGMDL